jgi:hypothetical protein
MPFNPNDYTKPPWTSGVMTLTHEECVEVKQKCQEIIDTFVPTPEQPVADTFYVVSRYNQLDWTKAINGDTYEALQAYDPETMTGGIPVSTEGE